jgi:hypothetical protein
VFEDAAIPLLFYNLDQDLWPAVKSFLVFLNRVPEYPRTQINDIPEDQECLSKLQAL